MYSNRLKSFIKGPNRPNVENIKDGPERTYRGPLQTSTIKDLNQYKVLPSIQRRISDSKVDLDQNQSDDDDDDDGTWSSDGAGTSTWSSPVCVNTTRLLLAIRAPCGERFVHHFLSSDTLQTVIITQQRFNRSYTGSSISTMDVPHRTFTELNITLDQAGITNRSVLVITQEQQE